MPFVHRSMHEPVLQIGSALIVDPTLEEEACMSARIAVAVNSEGQVCGMLKTGPGAIAPSALSQALKVGPISLDTQPQ